MHFKHVADMLTYILHNDIDMGTDTKTYFIYLLGSSDWIFIWFNADHHRLGGRDIRSKNYPTKFVVTQICFYCIAIPRRTSGDTPGGLPESNSCCTCQHGVNYQNDIVPHSTQFICMAQATQSRTFCASIHAVSPLYRLSRLSIVSSTQSTQTSIND